MKFFDRLLTIVITATLTSAVWIVFGTTLLKMAEDVSTDEEPAAIEAEPEPQTPPQPVETPDVDASLPDVTTPAAAPPVPQATPAPTVPETLSGPATEGTLDAAKPPEAVEDSDEGEADIAP
ncbi:MAG: hypothetical protein AAF251_03475 [Pseudomonadota bacterium]